MYNGIMSKCKLKCMSLQMPHLFVDLYKLATLLCVNFINLMKDSLDFGKLWLLNSLLVDHGNGKFKDLQ